MDWFKDNIWFLVSVFGGAIISVMTIDTHSLKEAAVRTSCGVFCAFFFTDSIIDWMSLDPNVYTNSVAGLFAISGYSLSKIFANFNVANILEAIKTIRGTK